MLTTRAAEDIDAGTSGFHPLDGNETRTAASVVAPAAVVMDLLPATGIAGADGNPGRQRHRLNHREVAVLGVGGLAVAICAWMLYGHHPAHTLSGTLALTDSAATANLNPGDSCAGASQDGYGDITSGAQVVVTDAAGKTIGTGTLSEGAFNGTSCSFSFAVPGVGSSHFYGIEIGNQARGAVQYSHAEITADDWSVSMTLGS